MPEASVELCSHSASAMCVRLASASWRLTEGRSAMARGWELQDGSQRDPASKWNASKWNASRVLRPHRWEGDVTMERALLEDRWSSATVMHRYFHSVVPSKSTAPMAEAREETRNEYHRGSD